MNGTGTEARDRTGAGALSEAIGAPLGPEDTPNFPRLLAESAQKYSQNLALISMHQAPNEIPIQFPPQYSITTNGVNDERPYLRWTHGQLQYAAEVLACGLRGQGIRKGEAIACYLHTCAEWAVLVRAASILACPFVPLNPRGIVNTKETEHVLTASQARVLVVADVQVASKLAQTLPVIINDMNLRIILEKSDADTLTENWIQFHDLFNLAVDTAGVNYDDSGGDDGIAMIVFTSGTTSLPKGGIHTNKSISASLISQATALRLTERSRTCCHMPMFHIGGIAIALGFMVVGGCTVFPSKGFDPASSLKAISGERCTNLPCVPAMLQILANHPEMRNTNTDSLVNVEMGATTILLEHFRQVSQLLRAPSVTNAFAATEAVPVTVGFFDPATTKVVNVGSICAGARLRICDPGSRNPIQRGLPGELHVGGPMVIRRYLAGTSAESFYEDEQGLWFISGDQGIMADDGKVTISGRYKDLIIRGGENIAPASIETVLDSKMGLSAQVVGVRSDEAGEVPVAVVQPSGDSEISTQDLKKTVLDSLGPGFVPEAVCTLKDLGLSDYPRTSSGKVRKVELKAIVQTYLDGLNDQSQDNKNASPESLEGKLASLWSKIAGVDIDTIYSHSSVADFADSLTIMRLRNRIKKDLGFEITTEELLQAGTITAQVELLNSKQEKPTAVLDHRSRREGPPRPGDIALTLGNPTVAIEIEKEVARALKPFGFTWADDVEDVLPSWDLGYEVFGSVAGTARVNHRMSFSTGTKTVEELYTAICAAIEHNSMHRSFELRGLHGEPTMRIVMRPNQKWFKYAVKEIPEVNNPDDLVALLNDGVHFSEVQKPYPSFLVCIARIKSTSTFGMIWALQHSAFDGLALYSFLEDLDALLLSPDNILPPHVPYKLWADMYYLHRTSLSAKRSVERQIQRLQGLSSLQNSIFPREFAKSDLKLATAAAHRKTFIAPVLFTQIPDLSSLRSSHGIAPFILIKAALSAFLAYKTGTGLAVFSQNENGRTWPFVEPWMQGMLPDCMDLAGPTLERTVQVISLSSYSSATVLSFLLGLKEIQDANSHDVHAPWNLVREGLPGGNTDKAMFDLAAMSTCLNYLPVRTKNGKVVFEAMEYHETKANCETAWLFNCGIEGEGLEAKMWTQMMSDDDLVSRESALSWTREVMTLVTQFGTKSNWEAPLHRLLPDPK